MQTSNALGNLKKKMNAVMDEKDYWHDQVEEKNAKIEELEKKIESVGVWLERRGRASSWKVNVPLKSMSAGKSVRRSWPALMSPK